MKHAFLIISHNEFEVLQMLIDRLDSERTDIFVHIDKKVKILPRLHTLQSRLYVLNERIDVRWGHVSQIECELLLFETAMKHGPYEHTKEAVPKDFQSGYPLPHLEHTHYRLPCPAGLHTCHCQQNEWRQWHPLACRLCHGCYQDMAYPFMVHLVLDYL